MMINELLYADWYSYGYKYLFSCPSDETERLKLSNIISALKPSWKAKGSEIEVFQSSRNNNDSELQKDANYNTNNQEKVKNPVIPDNVRCVICGAVIKLKKNMRRHIQVSHQSNEKKFECITYNISYETKYHLQRHHASKNCGPHECQKI